MKTVHDVTNEVCKKLVDSGKLVEGGWQAYCLIKNPPDHLRVMLREIYFLGAQHVFASIFGFVERGDEITLNDMRRMDNLHRELEQFVKSLMH